MSLRRVIGRCSGSGKQVAHALASRRQPLAAERNTTRRSHRSRRIEFRQQTGGTPGVETTSQGTFSSGSRPSRLQAKERVHMYAAIAAADPAKQPRRAMRPSLPVRVLARRCDGARFADSTGRGRQTITVRDGVFGPAALLRLPRRPTPSHAPVTVQRPVAGAGSDQRGVS